ncbi:unnamed protein product [Trypanosoma congolense IL3000]|uniref:WGS project CAEQ00000000 data, annotated contig 1846 n=1 Tax=Trypanosoma congolense (strain IL3000) TaxID=1068625 RepID=F9W9C1_TRYCI|nr:unnamed protein product [Trypanosoma congolense IL3000]
MDAEGAYFLIKHFEHTTGTYILYFYMEYKKGIISAFRFFTHGTTSNQPEQLKEGDKRLEKALEDIRHGLKDFYYNIVKDNLFLGGRRIRALRDFASNLGALYIAVTREVALSSAVRSKRKRAVIHQQWKPFFQMEKRAVITPQIEEPAIERYDKE